MGGSRGPTLTTIILALFLGYYHFRHTKISFKYIRRLGLTFIGFIIAISFYIIPLIASDDIILFGRINQTVEENAENEDRFVIWSVAWDEFLTSPIFGNHFLMPWLIYQGHKP